MIIYFFVRSLSYRNTPNTVLRKCKLVEKTLLLERTKTYRARQNVIRLKKRVQSLKDVVHILRNKNMVSDNAYEHLQSTTDSIPSAIMRRTMTAARAGFTPKSQIPDELKKFALTLNFYSSKAYDYVRKSFNFSLPHPSTLRKWTSGM